MQTKFAVLPAIDKEDNPFKMPTDAEIFNVKEEPIVIAPNSL